MQSSVAPSAPDGASIAICRSVVFSGQPAHDRKAVADGPAPAIQVLLATAGEKDQTGWGGGEPRYKRGDDPEAAEVG